MDKAFIDTLEHYVIQNGMDSVVAAVQYANKQNPKNYPAYVTTLLRNGFVPPKIETSYVNREVPSINREAPSASRLPSWLKPGVKILLNGKEVEVRSIIDDNISIERDDGIRLVIKEKHFLNALDDKRVSLVAGQLKMAQPVEEFDIDAFIEKLGQKVAANS
jgi:hypothetical protein